MANILQKQATLYHSYLSIMQPLRCTKGLYKQPLRWEKHSSFSLSAQLLLRQLWEQGRKIDNGSRCVVATRAHFASLLLFKDMNRKRSSKSQRNPLGCFFPSSF